MTRYPFTVAGGIFALIAAGCSSSGQSRTTGRIESIQDLRTGLNKANTQIDATVSALDGVVAASSGDLRPAYKNFDTQLAKLDSDAVKAQKRGEEMKARTREYFDAWKTEVETNIKNPELRRLSEDRQSTAMRKFEDFRNTAQTARESYQKFSNSLHEIKKYLDLELNPSAVTAAKPMIDKAKEDSKAVKEGLTNLAKELEETVAAISPTQAPPPAPAGQPGQPGQPAQAQPMPTSSPAK